MTINEIAIKIAMTALMSLLVVAVAGGTYADKLLAQQVFSWVAGILVGVTFICIIIGIWA